MARVRYVLLNCFQITWAPSEIPAYWPSQFSQKMIFPPSFSYQNWCQISTLKNFCHITWHQKPTVVLLIDTYIQKLNSQEHSCSWVHIYIRQQLAPLPDEIPSCSNHFRGSLNWTCKCRLKRIKISLLKVHKTYM